MKIWHLCATEYFLKQEEYFINAKQLQFFCHSLQLFTNLMRVADSYIGCFHVSLDKYNDLWKLAPQHKFSSQTEILCCQKLWLWSGISRQTNDSWACSENYCLISLNSIWHIVILHTDGNCCHNSNWIVHVWMLLGVIPIMTSWYWCFNMIIAFCLFFLFARLIRFPEYVSPWFILQVNVLYKITHVIWPWFCL